MTTIKFGTDGWRGIIDEDFTVENARIVANAIARYVVRAEDARKGVLVGYDHRNLSEEVAAAVAEVVSSTGTPVWLTDKPCPTPAISLLVRQRGAAGGMVVTASHNPHHMERDQVQSQLWQQRAAIDRGANRERIGGCDCRMEYPRCRRARN